MANKLKQDALELRNKFRIFVGTHNDIDLGEINDCLIAKHVAKRIALLHIDEVLEMEILRLAERQYYTELRKELEKLN